MPSTGCSSDCSPSKSMRSISTTANRGSGTRACRPGLIPARGGAWTLRFFLLCLSAALSAETRLKDLVSIEGVRDNQLVGYGIVVGLNKTGDKLTTVFSAQSLANALQKMGLVVNPTAII